jgi:hypothetical protein
MTVTLVIVTVVGFRPVGTTARASAERTNVLAAFNVPTRALDSQESQETAPFPAGRRRLRLLGNGPIRRRRKRRCLAMANAAQRQRKLAAKAARRKAVVAGKKKLEVSSASLIGRIRVASKGPFVRCLMSSTLFDIGIGHIVVARLLPSGLLGCAFFFGRRFLPRDQRRLLCGDGRERTAIPPGGAVRCTKVNRDRTRPRTQADPGCHCLCGRSGAVRGQRHLGYRGNFWRHRCWRLLRYLYIRQGRQALLHQRAERHAGTHPCHHPSSEKEPWYRKEPRYWLLGLPGQTRAQPYRTVLVGRFTEDK